MNWTRRQFLKSGATGLALTAITGNLLSCTASAKSSKGTLSTYGIQLYTLKDVIGKDPEGVLKQVAAMGYKQVEGFEGPKGMFWGMKNTEFKNYLDGLGMNMVSSHCNYTQNFEEKAHQAAEIGMKYLIVPAVGPRKTADEFKKIAASFNAAGETCKKAGLRFAYHNHDYPFKAVEGVLPLDIMMQETDPDLVDFEMDIYWTEVAGQDPIAWFDKYPNRFRLCHVKDRTPGAPHDFQNHSCVLGKGDINYSKILGAARKKGMEYFIYEQERFDDAPPLEAAALSARYLDTLKLT